MTRIQDVRVKPILGVSTLPQIKRTEGLANRQENFRANSVQGLNRRPPLEIEKVLLNEDVTVKHFWYQRKGLDYNIIITQNGLVVIWVGNTVNQDTYLPISYFNPVVHDVKTLILEEINDTVFILNPAVTVQMDTVIVGYFNQASHINIATALNYEDTLVIKATRVTATGTEIYAKDVIHAVTKIDYSSTTTPVDYGPADLSRATSTVAASVARQLNESAWKGFLQPLTVMFNHINSSADKLIAYGTSVGYLDYIAGGNDWKSNITSTTSQVNSILDSMVVLYGGTSSTARANLVNAQVEQSKAQAKYNQAVLDLAEDPLDPVLIAARDQALVELNVANADVVLKQAALDALADPTAYTTLWNQFNSVLLNVDSLVYNAISWGNLIIANGGPLDTATLTEVANLNNQVKTLYYAGEVPLEEIIGSTFRAYVLGTNISVYAIGTNSTDTVKLEITSGQGDKQAIIVHPITNNITNMPKYAIEGSIVTINPDPQSASGGKSNGVFYLRASGVHKVLVGTMTEVIWQETVNPWIKNKIKHSTLPLSILLEPLVRYSWVVGEKWRARIKGDETSCPNPSFIGERINSIGYFQKRLVFLAANNVIMSETDDIWNFYKASAIKLVVTDPIDIASSAPGVDQIKFITPHNRDMLVTSKNAQFKIPGNQAITPETVSMALTTRYIMQETVKPLSAGNYVYFAIDYGKSCGLFEYTAQEYTNQDTTGELTQNVVGYLKGNMEIIAVNETQHVLAAVTAGTPQNQLFVMDKFIMDGGKWMSWGAWFLPSSNDIIDMYMTEDYLHVVVKVPGGAPLPPLPPTTLPSFLFHLNSLPLVDAIQPSIVTVTTPPHGTIEAGVFDNCLKFQPEYPTQALVLTTNIVSENVGDFTIRFRMKNTGAWNGYYSHHFYINGLEVLDSYFGSDYMRSRGIDTTKLKTYLTEFRAISFEVKSGIAYLYFAGILETSWIYTHPHPTENLTFAFGQIEAEYMDFFVDEIMFIQGIALANGASTYAVETTPFLPA